jgi:ATP-dependent Clp protease ATP-binding subunit ClpA
MENKRFYHVIIGSKGFFDKKIPDALENNKSSNFIDLVKRNDRKSKRGFKNDVVKDLIVKNEHYCGIVEGAHDCLGALIEEYTTDDANIYIHNPPRYLLEYLTDQHERHIIILDIVPEEYVIDGDKKTFASKINKISSHIIGQKTVIDEISKSLWYLTSVNRARPYVIMLYGNSGLGKTELVRKISEEFFEGVFLEKHLSMFKNPNYSDYFFGNEPNRRSLAFDLLERKSNLVFFDEMDKCPEHFYSAFYSLFDNTIFKDATYDVDISNLVIVMTSNFHSEEEIKKQLGDPIFYRIDKYVHFYDFDSDTINEIVKNEIKSRKDEYNGRLTSRDVYKQVSPLVFTKGENARTIKQKVQQVIENMLYREIDIQLNNDSND